MQSVGIEPTLLRTRALSVRLNRSAKTAAVQQTKLFQHMTVRAMVGSIPSEVISLFMFTQDRQFGLCVTKKRFYRDLNPDYKDQNLGC